MKDELIEFLKKNIEIELDFESLLEKPKIEAHGDFSLPMFILSKEMKKNPVQIAKEMEDKLSENKPDFLEKIVATGPYLNFYLNKLQEAQNVIESIRNDSIFNVKVENPQKILIEYPSPNTNKSLHLGHVRNILLGNSLSKILRFTGNKIIRTNLNNDRGVALCMTMLGYDLFFKNETPQSLGLKPDEFVSKCYVKFKSESEKDPTLNEDAQKMLVEWEEGKKEVIELWKKILDWVFKGYEKTYENFKVEKFDKEYFESQIYDKGKEIVLNALKENLRGFGKEDDGAVFCDLSDIGLDKKYLLRGDGTTLYMTQDIYLAQLKEEEFSPGKSIFIVGKEQEYHFKVLFEILGRLGFGGADKNHHFAYGYVYDKNGKKFSSRKGKVIGADWLLDEIVNKSKENLLSKELTKDLDENELERRAKIIGYGALAFTFLKINPMDDIKFDMEKALAFEGETGPYIQYTYARIKSILRKADYKSKTKADYDLFTDKESSLVKTLKEYPEVVEDAAEKYRPSAVANYLIRLSQSFNDFYQNCPILKEQEDIRNARLVLIEQTSKILGNGLSLLNIETLEEM